MKQHTHKSPELARGEEQSLMEWLEQPYIEHRTRIGPRMSFEFNRVVVGNLEVARRYCGHVYVMPKGRWDTLIAAAPQDERYLVQLAANTAHTIYNMTQRGSLTELRYGWLVLELTDDLESLREQTESILTDMWEAMATRNWKEFPEDLGKQLTGNGAADKYMLIRNSYQEYVHSLGRVDMLPLHAPPIYGAVKMRERHVLLFRVAQGIRD